MFLVYVILVLFALLALLCFFEDQMSQTVKSIIYVVVGIVLIGSATFREIGFDPDSIQYETFFYSSSIMIDEAVEQSFIWISQLCRSLFLDVRAVFFIYALFGVALKLIAFPRLGDKENMLLMLLVYLAYTYELHETTQIRTGILSGCFLLALSYMGDGSRWKAAILLLVGTLFHTSGLALFPLLLLSNKPFTRKSAWVWLALIPISMALSLVNYSFDFVQDWGYIGEKIYTYQRPDDYGDIANVHVFSPLHFLSIFIACYLMAFHEKLTKINPNFPVLIKIYILALFMYGAFAFFPVVGERICTLYEVVWIPLIPLITYTFEPKGWGKLVSIIISFILLNYILRSMYNFVIFLEPLPEF